MSDRTEPDADGLVTAIRATPGVARMYAGRFGEIATYLPGRKVSGVEIGEERVVVHVVARYGVPTPTLAETVRAAAALYAPGFAIDVVIEDVELTPEEGAHG